MKRRGSRWNSQPHCEKSGSCAFVRLELFSFLRTSLDSRFGSSQCSSSLSKLSGSFAGRFKLVACKRPQFRIEIQNRALKRHFRQKICKQRSARSLHSPQQSCPLMVHCDVLRRLAIDRHVAADVQFIRICEVELVGTLPADRVRPLQLQSRAPSGSDQRSPCVMPCTSTLSVLEASSLKCNAVRLNHDLIIGRQEPPSSLPRRKSLRFCLTISPLMG